MMLSKFLSRIEFDSYEDLYKNFKITIPEDFNFAYDVVDEYAVIISTKNPPRRSIHLRVGYDGGLAREIATQIDTHLESQS